MADKKAEELNKASYPDSAFIHIGDKEYLHPKYLPFKVHCELVALFDFVKSHSVFSDENLHEIVETDTDLFADVIKVQQKLTNLVARLRVAKDEKWIPYIYQNELEYGEKKEAAKSEQKKSKKARLWPLNRKKNKDSSQDDTLGV